MERFVIWFQQDEESYDLGVLSALDVEYFEAESFENAVCIVADRIRSFDFGEKTVTGLGKCVTGLYGAA